MVDDELKPKQKAFPDELDQIMREQPLLHQIARTFWALKMAFKARLELDGPVAWILMLLEKEDGRTQTQLTNTLRVDASAITRMVKEMEQKGWITRITDPADNRRTLVYLTEAGRAKTHGLSAQSARYQEDITAGLSADQIKQLRLALQFLEDQAKRLQPDYEPTPNPQD